jgi:RNA recognition motif-containing protein
MANRLYVGNLPYTFTQNDLQQIFSEYGTVVSTQIISDRETGRSRGFAFVEMATSEGAQKALSELNGKDFEGRSLRVDVAQERKSGGGGGGGGGYDRGGGGGGYDRGGGGGGGRRGGRY